LTAKATILAVDDDIDVRDAMRVLLGSMGYLVKVYASGSIFHWDGMPPATA
jgi:FixJ family two-component response regulator